MKRDEIRLECLKLCMNRTRHPTDNVVEAKIYEEYILGALEEPSQDLGETKSKPRSKSTGNSDILS